MTDKELYTDCQCNPAFVLGVMWFDMMIWITQQMLIASSQLHGKEWKDA